MITFLDKSEFYKKNFLNKEELSSAEEFTESFEGNDDLEVKFAYSHGNLIFRYFSEETGYYFSPPYTLSGNECQENAFCDISEYCKLQEIPEILVDLIEEEIPLALRGAKHYDIDTDEDGMSMLRIYTECMMQEELPEILSGNVYLGEFSVKYAEDYEKLIKNENLNLHFGYNLCDDVLNGDGKDCIEFVREEFEKGKSMTFAATVLSGDENVFVGEGCLYAFDGRGSASVSFRVLPEYHKKGYGTDIFEGLLAIAKSIGLLKVAAEVKAENKASLFLLSKYGKGVNLNNGIVKFVFNLE